MNTKSPNAVSFLKKDHKEVKAMFKRFDGLSDRSLVSKKKVVDQICNALIVHTHLEEEIFYPVVRKAIKDDDLMDEALVEHAAAKQLIAQLLDMDAGDAMYDAKVKVLSEQIEHHVREEEDEMFPKVLKTKLNLEDLGAEMRLRKDELEPVAS
ncbi:MAG: hemerythrin domain-containing protein [Planctomycetota bacterium]|nr:hemerythrin domain-containing protein [Planctomycetota bacterium]